MGASTALPPDRTVGSLVSEKSSRAVVLEQLGIDYCCGGGQTLTEACRAAGVTIEELARRLDAAEDCAAAADEPNSWDDTPLSLLIDHIVHRHHAYLRAQLPRLTQLFGRVVAAHGADHPELREMQTVFAAMRDELYWHLLKEEHVLFPQIRRLESHGQSGPGQRGEKGKACCGGCAGGAISDPVRVMLAEHDDAGQALRKLRELSHDYHLPAGACNTWRILWEELQSLSADLHMHIHEENNVLFPRALAAADAQCQSGGR